MTIGMMPNKGLMKEIWSHMYVLMQAALKLKRTMWPVYLRQWLYKNSLDKTATKSRWSKQNKLYSFLQSGFRSDTLLFVCNVLEFTVKLSVLRIQILRFQESNPDTDRSRIGTKTILAAHSVVQLLAALRQVLAATLVFTPILPNQT